MDIMFENYQGDVQEMLKIIIKNEIVFSKMVNDVVGHRVLKLVIKKVFSKEEFNDQRKIVMKYFESDKQLNKDIKNHTGWVIISVIENSDD